MILLFKYQNKILQFTPRDQSINLTEYADTNLPNGTSYRILETIDNLTTQDLEIMLNSPDGISNNTAL